MTPDHAAWKIHASIVELLHFRLCSRVFSILQFLGNFLRSIPGEDGSSSPIHYTSAVSDAGLDLPIDWISIIVVFEIQAHAVTRIMRLLNFFAQILGLHVGTQSSIIFSEVNFHQLSSSFKVFSKISFTRIESSVGPSTVPSTLL